MKRFLWLFAILGFVAPAVAQADSPTTTLPEVTTTVVLTPPARLPLIVSLKVLQMAGKVATCEEGGWHNVHGPTYYGSLGWKSATWQAFRRADFPVRADFASIKQQAWSMARFAQQYGWPDQFGCQGGY